MHFSILGSWQQFPCGEKLGSPRSGASGLVASSAPAATANAPHPLYTCLHLFLPTHPLRLAAGTLAGSLTSGPIGSGRSVSFSLKSSAALELLVFLLRRLSPRVQTAPPCVTGHYNCMSLIPTLSSLGPSRAQLPLEGSTVTSPSWPRPGATQSWGCDRSQVAEQTPPKLARHLQGPTPDAPLQAA